VLTLILAILKFGAIGVATASGIVGTITNTRDKESGRATVWGKRIVALIVISGFSCWVSISIRGELL
jgi:hypothetical protein